MGKRAIHIRKEVPGHLANRLQAALWREAVHLVAEGVASVADVDDAIAYGPGLDRAIMGPHMTFNLGGGEGGMPHFLEQFSGPMESWWQTLGTPKLTPEVRQKLDRGRTRGNCRARACELPTSAIVACSRSSMRWPASAAASGRPIGRGDSMPKGYIIARANVTNATVWAEYAAMGGEAIKKYGGKPLVRGGRTEIVEGEGRACNIVLEFETSRPLASMRIRPNMRPPASGARVPASSISSSSKGRPDTRWPSCRAAPDRLRQRCFQMAADLVVEPGTRPASACPSAGSRGSAPAPASW